MKAGSPDYVRQEGGASPSFLLVTVPLSPLEGDTIRLPRRPDFSSVETLAHTSQQPGLRRLHPARVLREGRQR